MKRLLILCLGAAGFGAFAASSAPGEAKSVDASVEPKKPHEECVRMEKGDKRHYSWKSNGAVDFNVHYHEGPEVFYPIKRDGMRGDGGILTAKAAADYCWMWTARNAPVKVEGRIDPPRK
jgi:hypothetical protein